MSSTQGSAVEFMELDNRFIARQAILDGQSQCIGYELLYRDANNRERAVFEDAWPGNDAGI